MGHVSYEVQDAVPLGVVSMGLVKEQCRGI